MAVGYSSLGFFELDPVCEVGIHGFLGLLRNISIQTNSIKVPLFLEPKPPSPHITWDKFYESYRRWFALCR